MREILFRGKHKGNGLWMFGDLCQITSKGYCSVMEQTPCAANVEVAPETVGQFTGLTDKNGKKIFEGDIVNILTENEEIAVIEWAPGEAMFILNAYTWAADFDYYYGKNVEVIGNIYDNPELLKGN